MRFNIKNIKSNENSLYKCFSNVRGIKKIFGFLFNRESKLPADCIKGMKHLKPLFVSVFNKESNISRLLEQ